MSDRVIIVDNLGKKYQVGSRKQPYATLREQLTKAAIAPLSAAKSVFRGKEQDPSSPKATDFWALKDVSFEIKRGDVVGIVGRNGAGKSTLLKILSRITEPTHGRAEIRGRVGALLEVGTGFHPELTGRDNIYLNGAILGMKRADISGYFDEIVDFSEVEQFIDTPVKHYSSGMYLRLAFAVAAHMRTEVLVVDEVLAVGDAAFQTKCLNKMNTSSREGRTVLFVSHNMGALARLCNNALWLEKGTVKTLAPIDTVLSEYQSLHLSVRDAWKASDITSTEMHIAFHSIAVVRSDGSSSAGLFGGDEPIRVNVQYLITRPLGGCQIGARIHNAEGTPLFYTSDADETSLEATSREPGHYRTSFTIPPRFLPPGTYTVVVKAHLPFGTTYQVLDEIVTFAVFESGSLKSRDGRLGVVTPTLVWPTERIVPRIAGVRKPVE